MIDVYNCDCGYSLTFTDMEENDIMTCYKCRTDYILIEQWWEGEGVVRQLIPCEEM